MGVEGKVKGGGEKNDSYMKERQTLYNAMDFINHLLAVLNINVSFTSNTLLPDFTSVGNT